MRGLREERAALVATHEHSRRNAVEDELNCGGEKRVGGKRTQEENDAKVAGIWDARCLRQTSSAAGFFREKMTPKSSWEW